MSLKSLRDERDRLATELRSGIDPIEKRALNNLTTQQIKPHLNLSNGSALKRLLPQNSACNAG